MSIQQGWQPDAWNSTVALDAWAVPMDLEHKFFAGKVETYSFICWATTLFSVFLWVFQRLLSLQQPMHPPRHSFWFSVSLRAIIGQLVVAMAQHFAWTSVASPWLAVAKRWSVSSNLFASKRITDTSDTSSQMFPYITCSQTQKTTPTWMNIKFRQAQLKSKTWNILRHWRFRWQ